MKRHYYLDEKEIDSSEVDGFLNIAKKDKPFPCVYCGEKILKGQEYVRMNIPLSDDDLLHKECYRCEHSEKCVLAIKTERIYDIYHVLRTHIQCKDFSIKASPSDKPKATNGE